MNALTDDCVELDERELPVTELRADPFAESARFPVLDRISPELTRRLVEFFQAEQRLEDMEAEAFRLHARQLDLDRASERTGSPA